MLALEQPSVRRHLRHRGEGKKSRTMIWYIIPTIICLCIKLSILWFCRNGNHKSKVFIPLVSIIAALNLIEILGFSQFVKNSSPEFLLRMYYVGFVGVQAYICFYAVELSRIKQLRSLSRVIAILAISIVLMAIFSNHIVSGYKEISYSITAIKGDYYWVFQVFTLSSLLCSMCIFVIGYFFAANMQTKARCVYGLMSVLSIVLVMVAVIILQILGFKMNAMGILPVATTVFVLITLKTESNHNLTDILRFVPFSAERRITAAMFNQATDYVAKQQDFTKAMDEFGKTLIEYEFEKTGGNVSETARALKIPRSTLNSMMRRYGVGITEKEKASKQ